MSTLTRIIFDPDTIPPGIPSITSVIPVGAGRLDITWTAVTDTGGSGLAGYNLLIDGATTVNLGIQTSYSHTGLAASSTHTYRVQAVDGNGNASAFSGQSSGTVAGSPVTYNPAYPRFGSYSLGGTQNPSDAALASCHVNIIVTAPTWQSRKGVSWASKAASVKSLSTIGSLLFPYTIYPEIPDVNATAGQDFWEVWQRAASNNYWVFQNGATETNRIPSYQSGWSKVNYTTSSKLIAGESWAQWKLRWDYKLNVSGGTFSNGTSNFTVTANATGFDGTFFDNVFAQERAATTGDTGDYDRDGTQDTLSGATSKALIQSSHATNANFYRSLKPNAMVLGNSADWPIWYPSGITGTPLDQAFDGGLMEHMEEWVNGLRGSTMTSVLNAIRVQMDGYRAPKLGVCSVLISSATNYTSLRWWHAVCALTDTYYYPHLTTGLLAEELGTVAYDERNFSLGTAIDPTQYTARYQAGANGTGIYRRDFANGIVLCAAPTGTYTAVSLGGTFYRLTGTLDTTTNSGAAVSSVTLSAGQALVLSRTPAVSATFPLTVSGRQLRNKAGTPFFTYGDTPWLLMTGWTDSEVTQYLNDRQTRGFNALICELIEHFFTSTAPNTVTGLAPFTTPNDITKPNDAYFDRCVNIALQARARGMVLFMTPAYYGFNGTQEGWWPQAISTRTTTECQAFGAYIGSRFAQIDNIVWVMGGDYWTSATNSRTQALVAGLKSTGNAGWLYTYHADRGNSSADVVNAETWLNINAIYTDDQTIGSELETGYGVTPNRPMVYFEGYYEGEGATAQELRAQAYMSILTGGMGAFLGNSPLWKAAFGWQTAMSSAATLDRKRWADFFTAFAWQNLVPDRNDTVLTSGQGTLASMAYAARMSDGSKIVVYTPTQKALTIALSQLTGSSGTAAWYNPSTGVTTSAGTTGVTGTQTFTPPSSGDWVLTITAVQAAFTPFAVYKFNSGTNGQPCNTEYVAYSSSANPVVYAAGTGPFGETKVGRIQLISAGQASNENYYGGYLRLPAGGIPCAQGQEFWARAFFNLNPLYCAGGKGIAGGAQENVNGFLKFWRWFFDTQYRLTLLAGRDTGSGGLVNAGCGNPSTAPVLGAFNSEISSQNILSSPQVNITRSTNVPICIYLKWGAPNTANGICRAWINDQLVIQSTAFTNKPPGTFNSIANFTLPGDYYNGLFHDNNYFGDISNIILATSASPPPWRDAAGNAYIPSTVNALDY